MHQQKIQECYSIKQLKKIMKKFPEKVIIIDVRNSDEFSEKHIPEAINIPLIELEDRSKELSKEAMIFTVCGKGGGRSVRGAELLRQLGFSYAAYLCGGTFSWYEEQQLITAISNEAESSSLISPVRISRIKEQGYDKGFTDEEISIHAVGNRFAYQMCMLLFATGLILTSVPILTVAAIIALLAVILPYHPFDYLYNYIVRYWINRPQLPHRTNQARFACGIASVWLGVIVYLFYNYHFVWGYILGGILLIIALLVSIADFCIPSLIYNKLFRKKK
jgi:rhodanese-related sulfurtransferase